MKKVVTNLPEITTREEWLEARRKLLKREKELTRARDALNAERRKLPMVKIEKEYTFGGPEGKLSLQDLFKGRHQLMIYHFMFDPSWDRGCPSCSNWADQVSKGHLNHLHASDTTLCLVSRAPFPKLEAFKKRMGWNIPWYSSYGSDFNYDYHATTDEKVAPVFYNYRDQATLEHLGQHYHVKGEQPGLSCFLRHGNSVFHTYSTYGRGLEQVGSSYYFLDLTPLGRQEEWEEPEGRANAFKAQAGSDDVLYPDEYE
ncbi:DUF899 domain-containing protein [Aliifodinibius sp. S!AR15-10]|uniref:DUF899 domain-containing protein n=1 Tax=Aliifodinibius sp. S!AR15-10 TaxID=2950437 RepID=UPI002861876C|nr:DUF899 domain-containing protein [Aliifodinibius sp. S!AR15-10]MDR8393741.1 DUF899 domain-containing protein [Aliifodinibius sp. S!AR15-10]